MRMVAAAGIVLFVLPACSGPQAAHEKDAGDPQGDQGESLSSVEEEPEHADYASGEEYKQAALEADQAFLRCMDDVGWTDSELIYEGGVYSGFSIDAGSVDQVDALDADYEKCRRKFPPAPLPNMTREWAELAWEDQDRARQCLEKLGYVVPDIPSKEALIEEALATGQFDWDPRGDARRADPGRMTYDELLKACPYAL
ncbi:hypothetical protein [Schaalia sp. ZJ1691]|uniref:hypothetical protein n=1 Tax=Schaalia sp. ZJ1691 TaxID=2709404 RepID=UPI0013EBF5D1|nr:hypothetical protein [Schaalia sp. ZJ1691]